MPVEYLTPGVYVEEIESGLKPIAGVGTSTAGIIGEVADNVTMPPQPGKVRKEPAVDKEGKPVLKDGKPVLRAVDKDGKPVLDDNGTQLKDNNGNPLRPAFVPYTLAPALEPRLITSWEQFKNNFGDFQEGNKRLAHAVYGFFDNGGTRAWVSRVPLGAKNVDIYRQALDKFHGIDEIALLVIPGASVEVQTFMLSHCENVYLRDRFAILDGQPVTELTKSAIQGGLRDSSYGAIYYPWIQVFDPVTGARDYVPPSGHIAGLYAFVDSAYGVHKAPANETIRGALGVGVKPLNGEATEVLISKADQAGLNPHDINAIRKFDGNIKVWGAHTLLGEENSEWRYINVRRLFLFIEKSIDHGTQWVVFQPNDQQLWGKITREISDFLRRVWRSGALFGATESEAFFVKCDASNNPPEVRAAGQCIIDIGVAPVKPAEFVIFRITQWEPKAG